MGREGGKTGIIDLQEIFLPALPAYRQNITFETVSFFFEWSVFVLRKDQLM